jgi:hypothetical protein
MFRLKTFAALCLGMFMSAAHVTIAAKSDAVAMTSPFELPRYRQDPIYFFFESYILDVIGHLPRERSEGVQSMPLHQIFKTKSTEWRSVLRETLHLSQTVDVAILDLWYRNQDIAKAQGVEFTPEQFAMDFADEYMKDESQVDVWPPGALEAAKQRIGARRDRH